MSSPAYSYPVPPEVGMTDGEVGVAVTADAQVAGFQTFYLARHFDLPPGAYDIKFWSVHAAVLFAGTSETASRRIIGSTFDEGLRAGSFYLFEGERRFSVILTHLSVASTGCGFALSIWRNGRLIYASDETGWVFDSAPIPDLDITPATDARMSLPVFSVRPNWRDGVTERLMWQTDILDSETGIEQRRSVRLYPRRSFEASFMRHGLLRSRLSNMLLGLGRKQFLLPLWHEQYTVRATIPATTAGVSLPASDVTDREFRVGDLVLIDGGNPNDYEIVKIATLNTGTGEIVWEAAPLRAWSAGSRITPLRVARITEDGSLSNLTDAVGQAQLRFELVEPDDQFVDPADDPTTNALSAPTWDYCAPLFQFQPNRASEVSAAFSRVDFALDNQAGIASRTDPSDQGWIAQRFDLLFFGRSDVFRFRRFIAKARGRAVRFYMPTFTNDVLPATDEIGGTEIVCKPSGLVAFTQNSQATRHMLAIVFRDGSPTVYRKITDGSETRDGFGVVESETLTLDSALPTISMGLVKRIEWITVSRFDQDTFELHHHVDNSAAVSVAVVTRSVDDANMEPIDCWVTSAPYPAVAVETMESAVALDSAVLKQYPVVIEGVSTETTVASGDLRDVLITYTESAEGIDGSVSLDSGAIEELLVTSTGAPEGVDGSVTLDSGTIDDILVSYDRYTPEGVSSTCTLVSGTLA